MNSIITSYTLYSSYKYLTDATFISNPDKYHLLALIFNDLHTYIDSININIKYEFILYMYEEIYINKNATYDELIKFIFDNIYDNYCLLILNFIETITEINDKNLLLSYYIKYYIYKIIILLYSYYFYINVIKDLNLIPQNFKLISNVTNNDDFYKKLFYIINTTYNNDATYINYNDQVGKEYILKIVINNFNLYILNDPTGINTININNILQHINTIHKKNILSSNIYEKKIFNLIIALNHYDTINKQLVSDTDNIYITLPQYENNCWYISMLTCMCFSDASKYLLINKIRIMEQLNIKLTKPDDIFFSIIYTIISEITVNFKKYDKNKYNNCAALVYFKKNLMKYIYDKYNQYISDGTIIIKDKIEEKSYDNIMAKYIGSDLYHYYMLAFKYHNKLIDSSKVNIETESLGCQTVGYVIINTFYKIFDINTLYLYKYNDKLHCQNENFHKQPDIIFIQVHNNKFVFDFMNLNNAFTAINYTSEFYLKDDNSIILNGFNYELDYIMHISDDEKSIRNIGHVISGIHYDGEQYYHDSNTNILEIKCDKTDVIIPCSLIKQEWKSSIYFNDKYCFKSCFHLPITTETHEIDANTYIEDSYCYDNNADKIYAYIKKNSSLSGGSNKLIQKKI